MIRNYLRLIFRNLWKSRFYTFLNIFGLAIGMSVTLLIVLWIKHELSFDSYHKDYNQIARVSKNRTYHDQMLTETGAPLPLIEVLKSSYPNYFEEVVASSAPVERILGYDGTAYIRRGYFMGAGGEKILDLDIIKGHPDFPISASSLLVSESLSKSVFGDQNPIGKIISIDNNVEVEVIGVYKDLPTNSTFQLASFYGSFELLARMHRWIAWAKTNWQSNYALYVKIAPNVNFEQASALIKDEVYKVTEDPSRPELFLYPMNKWHLYPDFEGGKWIGTHMKNLWLYGSIGVFVLLLAMINFVNLSTARAEKRAKEIGIRKSVGSLRSQLTSLFLMESFVVVFLALGVALITSQLSLPYFNSIVGKNLEIDFGNPIYWGLIFLFGILTGILAGSYPAFFLSSFNPVKVLKGITSNGKTVLPRKILVVLQFGISMVLIISTLMIYKQIQFGTNREVGYGKEGLIQIWKVQTNITGKSDIIRQELQKSGAVVSSAESDGPISEMWNRGTDFYWKGKNPNQTEEFITLVVTPEFGETVQWKVIEGRDFSREYSTDSSAIVLTRSAADVMGLENPIDEIIRWENKDYRVIGVVDNLLMESPFDEIRPTVITMQPNNLQVITIRLNPKLKIQEALDGVNQAFKKINPGVALHFNFVDQELDWKFNREIRMARLSSLFSGLAILISLIGVFGLATFVAEQKMKEIGIRKVLGSGILRVSFHISKQFILLVGLAFLLAAPIAYFFIESWLSQYEMRTPISFGVFFLAGIMVIVLTLVTVGYQSIKAAMVNPAKILRSE